MIKIVDLCERGILLLLLPVLIITGFGALVESIGIDTQTSCYYLSSDICLNDCSCALCAVPFYRNDHNDSCVIFTDLSSDEFEKHNCSSQYHSRECQQEFKAEDTFVHISLMMLATMLGLLLLMAVCVGVGTAIRNHQRVHHYEKIDGKEHLLK
jgi:hypothetical protein